MIRLLAVLLLLWGTVAAAVEPWEMLDDPVLEARAQDIGNQLRCPVCTSESIEESRAPVASDLRLLVRERLLEGDSDREVMDFVAARYGERVLLNPRATGTTLILWLSGPVLGILAVLIALRALRGRQEDVALSAEEEARLKELTGE